MITSNPGGGATCTDSQFSRKEAILPSHGWRGGRVGTLQVYGPGKYYDHRKDLQFHRRLILLLIKPSLVHTLFSPELPIAWRWEALR